MWVISVAARAEEEERAAEEAARAILEGTLSTDGDTGSRVGDLQDDEEMAPLAPEADGATEASDSSNDSDDSATAAAALANLSIASQSNLLTVTQPLTQAIPPTGSEGYADAVASNNNPSHESSGSGSSASISSSSHMGKLFTSSTTKTVLMTEIRDR